MSEFIYLTDRLYLAIDQGGHATRAMVFDYQGQMVSESQSPISTSHPAPGFVEHDTEAMVQSLQNVIDATAKQLGDQVKHLYATGLATQRSNCLCWHKKTGQPLSPIISWQDTRNADWLESLHDQRDNIHKHTGLFLSPHYGASKLRWCLENLEAVKQAHQQGELAYGPMSSYLVQRLTGIEARADAVNASRTQVWSLHTKKWDQTLLERFGLEEESLPECVSNDYLFGKLKVGTARVPLTCVTGDQSSALFAYGKLQAETAYVNIGTGAFVSRPSGYAKLYGRRLLTSVAHQFSNRDCLYVLEGTVNGAGSALQWFSDNEKIDDLFEQLPGWLENATEPPLFLNGISGLAAPFWQSHFDSRFIGEGNTAQQAVAIVESIVFLIKANIEEMQKTSSPPQQLQLSGGLGQLDGLAQRLADLTGLTIYRPGECEATARGLAYLLAEQPDNWPEDEPGQWFEPQSNPTLQQRYVQWHEAMLEALRAH
jgi:glycerol kinase